MSFVLSEHLPLLASAPDGIQKLRGLILELAVRGKLVPQDPNDESASELLKRIAKERERLEVGTTRKKNGATPPVSEEEQPFALPEGWEWCRFGTVLDFQGGGQPPKSHFSDKQLPGYVQLIQIRDLGERPQPVFIRREDAAKFCTPNDIMVGRYGASVGKVFWGKDGAYNVALVKMIDLHSVYARPFLHLLLRSPLGQSYFCGISRSAQDGFNKTDLENRAVPVLPLPEQFRIVAKVDELMALCDRLESEQTDAEAAHAKLVETLLSTLTQCTDAADLAANWQRLAEHFDTLFTTESSLDALKQTILQLAVMGKLVPQDPNDEPASELLKRIAKERARLEAEGTCKKSKAMPLVGEDEQPFAPPANWIWIRLGVAIDLVSGQHLTPDEYSDGHSDPIPYLTGPAEFGDLFPNPTRSTTQTRAIAISGDILITVKGSGVGKLNRVSQARLAISRQLMAVRTIAISSDFTELALRAAEQHFQDQTVGIAIPGIGRDDVQGLIVGLPPLSEQHRIVAKVDELTALCDRLKADLAESRTRQSRLSATLIESALQAA